MCRNTNVFGLCKVFKANTLQMAGACNLISMLSLGRILYGYYHMQDMRYLAAFQWRMFMIASPSSWLTMAGKNRRLLDDSGQLRF